MCWVPLLGKSGDNREPGANPGRSRHCEWGAFSKNHWVLTWEGGKRQLSMSQETCPAHSHVQPSDGEGWVQEAACFSHTFCVVMQLFA